MSIIPISLDQLLMLVGELSDRPGNDTARDRFRQFLATSVTSLGTVRDYVNVCLTRSDTQYNRALQDLINHTGRLMGFEVEFGRYAGTPGEIGHDGLWLADDFAIVVEVKTTDAYSIKTSTLLGYMNALIDAGKIASADKALGLYVFGRPDAGLEQLEGSIAYGGHAHRLRIATADDILSLAELVQEDLLTRNEALALLRPTGVRVSTVVGVLNRIVGALSQDSNVIPGDDSGELAQADPVPQQAETSSGTTETAEDRLYLLTPVANEPDRPAEEIIRTLLGRGFYVFGERTPGRKRLKPGDMLAFYETGKGVVATAEVASTPERKRVPGFKESERFPWAFKVKNVNYFFDDPVAIDANLRARLNKFKNRNPQSPWSWFVQGTAIVDAHDFALLTGGRYPVQDDA
ncbi:hypothetical protein [Sphaerobacter sp.]|uniref:hypothetical protein n=1 Tax=Sphaerobacter sp. TaxID=2099654 RepID=UPI001DCA4E33|nr:hypothetical protein [Sphaerobacter sp.]MBX5445672.1 EVE domain-containing protein [Sphaerobacter sp.]